MPTLIYVEHDGTEHPVEVDVEMNLMEGATLNMVPGVEGMCGGLCSCATCHVFLDESWKGKVPEILEGEENMLAPVASRTAESRLGCQVIVTESMEGLRVNLPETQG